MSAAIPIRDLVVEQLDSKDAHVDFMQAVQGLTHKQTGIKVEGLPHTIWELIEHIRISQDDILEFCKNPDYEAPNWPDDYWPASAGPENEKAFHTSVRAVPEGIKEMKSMVSDPQNDLLAPIPHGDGQTLFREAMLFVDHNAYHIGQIVQVRRSMGSW
ncbi:DinB superfamily protein [Fodinibius roseus]|uniref:DinB superfamily protein n=1 Tax=Fodinibius roseus TaxID=1194090 RepID=A0A1M5FPZ9_9BACT|nr:DinB family protein [Fodinibius roseus]SHF93573.1 DinB superfamily protein [Fodinibius roseus]